MNVRIGDEAAQFYFWEYINRIYGIVHKGLYLKLAGTKISTLLAIHLPHFLHLLFSNYSWLGKQVQTSKYPLEGKDFFHASNCDNTHLIYHQVYMTLYT
jgi:hypothetical protein